MYISADLKRMQRYAAADVSAAVFFAFFGGVYEHFSHEVYSYFMLYAFAVPLFLGALPLLLLLVRGKQLSSACGLLIFHCGLAALTVGAVFKGVLDIYGTTNRLLAVYPVIGGALCLIGLIAAARSVGRNDSEIKH